MRTYRKVDQFEQPVADLMIRHADRFDNEAPRGIWVYEQDGEPEVLLLAFTERYLRLAFVVDHPQTVTASQLMRLKEEFEGWATNHQISRYVLIVPEWDDHYRKMVERLGAIELRRAGGWVEYAHEIGHVWNTPDGIRAWTPKDWVPLRPLMRAFLKQDVANGGDLPPVRQNVEELIRRGVQGAHRREPFLVAQDEGRIVGFICVSGVSAGPYELRGKPAQATGLYVLPHLRKQGWARKLYEAALLHARGLGYDRVTGITRTKNAYEFHKHLGFDVPGGLVHRDLKRL